MFAHRESMAEGTRVAQCFGFAFSSADMLRRSVGSPLIEAVSPHSAARFARRIRTSMRCSSISARLGSPAAR